MTGTPEALPELPSVVLLASLPLPAPPPPLALPARPPPVLPPEGLPLAPSTPPVLESPVGFESPPLSQAAMKIGIAESTAADKRNVICFIHTQTPRSLKRLAVHFKRFVCGFQRFSRST